METKGIILGALGQKLDEKLKEKLNSAIMSAIEQDKVTAFYFLNEDESIIYNYERGETEEKDSIIEAALSDRQKICEYILDTINEYRQNHTECKIKTVMFAARPIDKNYNQSAFDEVLQGYYIYHNDMSSDEDLAAFNLRDEYISRNLDLFYWISDTILTSQCEILRLLDDKTKIRYI